MSLVPSAKTDSVATVTLTAAAAAVLDAAPVKAAQELPYTEFHHCVPGSSYHEHMSDGTCRIHYFVSGTLLVDKADTELLSQLTKLSKVVGSGVTKGADVGNQFAALDELANNNADAAVASATKMAATNNS